MYTTTTGDPRDLARKAEVARRKRAAKANQRMAAARIAMTRVAASSPGVGRDAFFSAIDSTYPKAGA